MSEIVGDAVVVVGVLVTILECGKRLSRTCNKVFDYLCNECM